MVQTLKILERRFTDEQMEELKGKFVDESYIKHCVRSDTDVFLPNGKLLLSFRKRVIDKDDCEVAFHSFKNLAKASRGRGAAAGYIDPESTYWKKRDLVETKKWSTKYMVNGSVSKMKVNSEVASNPIGFYGETKNLGLNLPCRLSHYTRTEFLKYDAAIPFIEQISKSYKKLSPENYKIQLERANINASMKISKTPFSTVTVNRNFRTAIHKDAGDFGFGNLSVLEYGRYSGGYLVFPQFGIGVDLRDGDHLCCDVHQYHANTELFESKEDKIYNDTLEDIFQDNLDVGILGLNNRFARISLVCYLREDLNQCTKIDEKLLKPEFEQNKKPEIFVINLKKDSERRKKFLKTNYTIFPACDHTDVSQNLKDRMISYWNMPEKNHLSKCACFLSHVTLLQKIINMKLNNVVILEDDAIQVSKIPTFSKFPKDGVTYLGGFIANAKITSKEPIVINHKKGINELDLEKYQMCMTLSYYIPTWEIALELLTKIVDKARFRAIDIELTKSTKIFYNWPANFIEDAEAASNIRDDKQKHSNNKYEWVKNVTKKKKVNKINKEK